MNVDLVSGMIGFAVGVVFGVLLIYAYRGFKNNRVSK